MSALDRVRDRFSKPNENFENLWVGTDKTDKRASVGSVSTKTQVSGIRASASTAIPGFSRDRARLDMERIDARCKGRHRAVLEMLAAAPESVLFAFQTFADAHPEFVIVAIAIRGAGTAELSIDRERYDAFALAALLGELHGSAEVKGGPRSGYALKKAGAL